MLSRTILSVLILSAAIIAQEFDSGIEEKEKLANSKLLSLSKINYPGDSKIDVTYYKLDLKIIYSPQ